MKNNVISSRLVRGLEYCFPAIILGLLLFSKPTIANATKQKDNKLIINVYYKQYELADSLRLYINDVLAYDKAGDCYYPKRNPDKSLRFNIPVENKYGYFSIRVKSKTAGIGDMDILNPQFWETGDSITLHINHKETLTGIQSTVRCSGRGSSKYVLQEKMSKIVMVQMDEPSHFNGDLLNFDLEKPDRTDRLKLSFLDENQHLLSPLSYNVLKAELVVKLMYRNLLAVREFYTNKILGTNKQHKEAFIKKFQEIFYTANSYQISNIGLANSKDYINYLYAVYHLDALMKTGQADEEYIYKAIVDHTSDQVCESSLLLYFNRSGASDKVKHLYKSAERYMTSPQKLAELHNLASRSNMFLDDYRFKDVKGKLVKISDFKNKIVLIDLWFWGCGGCAAYYRNVLSKLEKEPFINRDLVILSISVDKIEERWKKGLNSGIYTSDRAVNVSVGTLGWQHPILTRYDINWLPTKILIDRLGKVVAFNTIELSNYKDLMTHIRKLL